MPRLVLASASLARRETLVRAGVLPQVIVSAVDEDTVVARYGVAAAPDVALVLARAKAEAVAGLDEVPDDAVVLGCDSVLELNGQVHGKPADAEQARARWQAMRGGTGVLHTGHWLVDCRDGGSGATIGAVAATVVHFARISDAEIDAYLATGEPLQVSGGFTIDALGGAFVTGVEGDHHNVVGLSLPLLRDLLADVGIRWTDLWHPTQVS